MEEENIPILAVSSKCRGVSVTFDFMNTSQLLVKQ